MNKWYEKSGPEGDVVISTRIRLARNLAEYPFPAMMNKTDRCKLMQRIIDAAGSCKTSFHFINMEDLSNAEAVSLVERHIASPEFISERDGRGILLSQDESVSVILNAENHLALQSILEGLNLQQAYQTADKLDTDFESLHFAFDEALGYLTRDPADLGTGMRASLLLHLPALKEGGGIARISVSLSKLGLTLRGIYGSGTESRGAVYQLSNLVTLGLSEQEAIANLKSIAMQIIGQERSARKELAQRLDVQDTVSRSLGILQNARIMTNDEFMGLISNLRFGVAAGLIETLSYETVNRLIVEAQPATLMLSSGKKLTPNERRILRAEMVRDIFLHENDKAVDQYGRSATEQ